MCVKYMVQERGKRKVIFRIGEDETEIDIVVIKKEHWQFI